MNAKALLGSLVSLLAVTWSSAQPQPGTVLWTIDVGRTIYTSPAVSPDGTVYVGSDIELYAITNNGSIASKKWTVAAGIYYRSPAIGPDGTIYFNDGDDGRLRALNPDGSEKWASVTGGAKASPAIGFDDTVYFIADGRLHAVDASGGNKWNCLLESNASYWLNEQPPIISSDGTIYVRIADKLHAVSHHGTNKWSVALDFLGEGPCAIGRNGTIYVSARMLYAISPVGTVQWSSDPDYLGGPHLVGSPVIGNDNAIYVAEQGTHSLHTYGPAGEKLWSYTSEAVGKVITTAPAVDHAGNIHYCVSNSVVAMNSQGQALWTVFGGYTLVPWILANTSPVIGSDGTLYASLGDKLYAIATGTFSPPNSPWPMYRQNARQTGKVEEPTFLNARARNDANFQFQLYAQLGQTNTVETSTNLTSWTPLTNVVITNVPLDVVDLTASNSPTRFYRAISP